MANNENLKPFKKGYDARRNLRGVPSDTIAMRKHMRKIAAEIIGGDETAMSRLDAMLRQLFTSRNPAHNKLALQVLDPKILTEHTDITSNGNELGTNNNAGYERAISTLASALREIVPAKGNGEKSEVDTTK